MIGSKKHMALLNTKYMALRSMSLAIWLMAKHRKDAGKRRGGERESERGEGKEETIDIYEFQVPSVNRNLQITRAKFQVRSKILISNSSSSIICMLLTSIAYSTRITDTYL